MADADTQQVSQKRKMPISPFVILAVATIFILWLIALFMSTSIYEDYGMDITRENWVYIGSIVMIGCLVALLLIMAARSPAPQFVSAPTATATAEAAALPMAVAEPAPQAVMVAAATPEAVVESEPLVVEAEIVEAEIVEEEEAPVKELKLKKPTLIEYPKKVPGGVYGDTIIRTAPREKLNLRTLLVRSCMICDRQGKCWEEIKDTLSRDDFLGNIECKKGLRKLKSHGVVAKPSKKRKKMVMKVKKKSPPEETES